MTTNGDESAEKITVTRGDMSLLARTAFFAGIKATLRHTVHMRAALERMDESQLEEIWKQHEENIRMSVTAIKLGIV